MKLAVVNASVQHSNRMAELIEGYGTERDMSIDAKYFHSCEELLSDVKQQGPYDAYVIEVLMPEYDGIELGKRLTRLGEGGKFFYTYGESSRAWQAFRVDAIDYLLRNRNEGAGRELFNDAMDKTCRRLRSRTVSPTVSFRINDGFIRIRVEDLLYATLDGRRIALKTVDGSRHVSPTVRGSFAKATSELQQFPEMLLIRPSLIINMKHIRRVDEEGVTMNTGERINASKSHLTIIERSWGEFCNGTLEI